MRQQQKNVPFRLSEDLHANFKSYCAQNQISMQAFLEEIVKVALEKNETPQMIISTIEKMKEDQ